MSLVFPTECTAVYPTPPEGSRRVVGRNNLSAGRFVVCGNVPAHSMEGTLFIVVVRNMVRQLRQEKSSSNVKFGIDGMLMNFAPSSGMICSSNTNSSPRWT